jgi:hypothetical protein
MSKKKRTYNSEVIVTPSLQLQRLEPLDEKVLDQKVRKVTKGQFFSPEMISRLAERIKKL